VAVLFASVAMFAAVLPLARLLADESSPAQATPELFRVGYQAWNRRDFPATIAAMNQAANLPGLGDYALFYLGAAQAASNDLTGAASSYRQLTEIYPLSVLADGAGIEYARLELKLGHPDIALAAARRVVDHTEEAGDEQNARLVVAQAAFAQGDFREAYSEAQRIREKYPRGQTDTPARALAYASLAATPSVGGSSPLDYHRSEAALLVREGQSAAALEQVNAALALAPPAPIRTELYWIRAEASRGNEAVSREALSGYLAIAPGGVHAPEALGRLARIDWRHDDTEGARNYFARIVAGFPRSAEASAAMFEIGRTFEDDGDFVAARSEYLRLTRRYPSSDSAEQARFRAPFLLYRQGSYAAAAAGFETCRAEAATAADRDGASYWQARSLEREGIGASAERLYRELARSMASNYYPSLASRKVALEPDGIPGAEGNEVSARFVPEATGAAGFHLARIVALRDLGIRELEAPELRAIAGSGEPALRHFVLAEMQAAGAWYDAIVLATAMAARGEIDAAAVERVRYPRGFWELISGEATRGQLDPWLVAALIRQESLYDPHARSGSDARGLMQLMPATAERWAPVAGLNPASLDLYDPGVSVRIGTTYLKGLLEMFDNDPFKAVAAYNGGEHAVATWNRKYPGEDDQWVENIEYRETRDYVKKVIGGRREYRLLYGSLVVPIPASAPASSPG
jgi:soluble lytic murein transglycosylase